MALLELKRSLLLPAMLLAASLTLVGCSGAPSNTADNSNSSSSDSDSEADDAEDEEAAEASTGGNCPAGFEAAAVAQTQQDATITVLSAAEFDVPEVGLDILASGCLFETTADVDGTPYTAQSGYLPGDATVLAEIAANLEAGGYESMSGVDGFYTLDTTSIVIFDSADLPGGAEAAKPLNLGFGDNFLVITVIQA